MIDYKLAKQLKEAGFPQEDWEWLKDWENKDTGHYNTWEQYSAGFIPTLSELIEACGKDFWELSQWEKDNWQVMSNINPSKNGGIITTGKSPEEAVAKLWLKLNEE